MPAPTRTDPPSTEVPIYWFAKLDAAVTAGDFAAASEAQKQLARLGVLVRYGRPGGPSRAKCVEVSDAR